MATDTSATMDKGLRVSRLQTGTPRIHVHFIDDPTGQLDPATGATRKLMKFVPGSNQKLVVDFDRLALFDSDFKDVYQDSKSFYTFQDPASLRQLTISTMRCYFDIKMELPDDRLCPPVPNRWEYIRWIADILDSTAPLTTDLAHPAASDRVIGIDIGTGASCIYPLLGCSSLPLWHFHATDIDAANLASATHNISLNDKYKDRITLHARLPTDPLLDLDAMGIAPTTQVGFVMCNPPFFNSKQDMNATYLTKRAPPSAVCHGAEIEMITPGGDLGFVTRIIEESCVLRQRVRWYSSMFGKKESCEAAMQALKARGITMTAATELDTGAKTKRWALAWSFGLDRPCVELSRGISTTAPLPFPSLLRFSLPAPIQPTLPAKLPSALSAIDLTIRVSWDGMAGIWGGAGNVWSRAARRKRKREEDAGEAGAGGEEEAGAGVVGGGTAEDLFRVRVEWKAVEGTVEVRWLRGADSVVFESFVGWLRGRLVVG